MWRKSGGSLVREILQPPNLLSMSRILLLAPILYTLSLDTRVGNLWCLAWILVAVATDLLDGRLARRNHQITEWGKILDPLADKICIGVVVMCLYFWQDLPLWLMGVVVGRDLLILLASAILLRRYRFVMPSNFLGKLTAGLLALLIAVYVLDWSAAKAPMNFVAACMVCASSISYVVLMKGAIRPRSAE